ncbi:hypothetical protein EBT31_04605 [bacterium]|jgi:hypothetical protein|nr:hypothetical protein [bacterium]NBX50595.1 hypothetical protein [bacterium]
MAFTGNFTCNVFKTGLMNGSFNFTSGTFYIALYTNAATLDANTTAYTTTGEATGGNYSAGGQVLTVSQVPTIGNQTGIATSYISFSNAAWTGSITARGALIYKAGDNGAVCVLDFGSDKSSVNTFTVQFPAVTNTSAIIRIS